MGFRQSRVLNSYDLDFNKIASPMIVYEVLEEVSKQKKHTFISTGMSNFSDIEKAVNILRKIHARLN